MLEITNQWTVYILHLGLSQADILNYKHNKNISYFDQGIREAVKIK